MREIDRRRHERAFFVDLALGAGEAEHHALVAGAFLVAAFLLLGVDAHGDIRRLAVQQHLDVGAIVGEPILVVADVLHHLARGFRDQLAVDHRLVAVFVEQRRLAAALAGDDDLVRRAQSLAAKSGIHFAFVGDAELEIVLKECVENGVGNLIADFVGMSFRHRLAREQIV